MLMCLDLLAAASADEKMRAEANARGWDARAAGITQLVIIVRVKNRFEKPTSGGWARAEWCPPPRSALPHPIPCLPPSLSRSLPPTHSHSHS